jgi:two-component system response regulator MprA
LAYALTLSGYGVTKAEDEAVALDLIRSVRPSAVIVDLTGRSSRGKHLCTTLRRSRHTVAVLLLGEVEAPFDLGEILNRLDVILGAGDPSAKVPLRSHGVNDDGEVLWLADVVLDRRTREVRRSGRQIKLTQTEFNLLALFLQHPDRVLERPQIFLQVWGFDFAAGSNTLNVHVRNLRLKLGSPQLIETVPRVGYMLRTTQSSH